MGLGACKCWVEHRDPPHTPPQVPVGPELYVSQPKSEGRSSLLECLGGLLSGRVPQMPL